MPRVKATELTRLGTDLLEAAGAAPDEAAVVIRHLVGSNLAGHDSHGVIRIPSYVSRFKSGDIKSHAPLEFVRETETTIVADAHWGLGYVATEHVMAALITKAEKMNVAAATIFRQDHIGRLASYPLMAAERGMIGLITADSGRAEKTVAPFGGGEARLGSNPISIAIPSNLPGPLFIDMATSAVSGGKVSVALARGEKIPIGWIIDSEGRPTADPSKHRTGGALLPLGGSEGYKGYGLAVVIEILCGILTGLGFGVEPTGRHNDGCFLAVFKVDAFRALDTFKQEVTDFAKYLHATRPAEGSAGVLYPGEIEYRNECERAEHGIDIEDATWNKLIVLAKEFGVRH